MPCWKPATPSAEAAAARGLEWLKPLQVLDVKGDWAEEKPDVRPGGWAFQYRNDYYPDLDDTAVVVMAMDRAQKRGHRVGGYDAAPSPAAPNGWMACKAGTAAGAPSMPTIAIIISTIFPLPIMARCSTRPPRMFRAAVSA